MSVYLTLSGPGATSLLSPESALVNSNFVMSRLLSGFCLALSRLLSLHQDCCSLFWMKRWSNAEHFFLVWLQHCSTGIYELRVGVVSCSTLYLSRELPEMSKRFVSAVCQRSFSIACYCFTGHSLEHLCLFLNLHLNTQIWVCFADFLLPQCHHLSAHAVLAPLFHQGG